MEVSKRDSPQAGAISRLKSLPLSLPPSLEPLGLHWGWGNQGVGSTWGGGGGGGRCSCSKSEMSAVPIEAGGSSSGEGGGGGRRSRSGSASSPSKVGGGGEHPATKRGERVGVSLCGWTEKVSTYPEGHAAWGLRAQVQGPPDLRSISGSATDLLCVLRQETSPLWVCVLS